MADDHGNGGGSGGDIDKSALSPKYPAVATDPSDEAPANNSCPGPIKNSLWRPFTLRPPTLLFFLFLTIALIATVESLNRISTRNGALTFAGHQGELSTAQTFCYRYLPQMVIVLYGIGWAAVDLDVKRLEPYFQLSKPGGASASDSILLHYPFDFLALVPVTAAKRKHWSVFAAGTALVMIFWAITPLQSSFLTKELVTQETSTQFIPTAKLLSYSNQSKELNATYLHASYRVTWMGEKIAGFMTREFVAIPFKPVDSTDGEIGRGNNSWTAITKAYQTYIDCVPATIVESAGGDGTYYNFSTDGCSHNFSPVEHTNENRHLFYVGYNDTGDWYLNQRSCKVKNIFLGVWVKSQLQSSGSRHIDVAAIFCRQWYSYADVDITVDATNLEITRSRFIGEPNQLTAQDGIIDIGTIEGSHWAGNFRGIPFLDRGPDSRARYANWDIGFDSTHGIGPIAYAIGLENKTFDDFRDPNIFGDAMNKTHKLLFNYAVRALFRDEGQPQHVNGTRIFRNDGITVVPVVAHLLASFLFLVAVCLAGLFLHYFNRPNNLPSDLDTLATTMALVAQSPQLLRDFEGADNCPDIKRYIHRRWYKLYGGEDSHRLDILDGSEATFGDSHESSTNPHDGRGVRPWELGTGMGIFTTTFSAGILVLLAVLFWSSQKYSGLPTLSNRKLVVQFIFSFTPTALATLIEPLWVVVTRYLALYQPWTELNRGHSSSATSLGLKYTNLPPVLIAPRALAGSHYILALASTVVLASSGLAVALGGLFDSGPRPISAAMAFEFPLSASIDTQPGPSRGNLRTFVNDTEEYWLVALANSTGNPLPPWVAPEFYFLPFEWSTTDGDASALRSANTWGFGANLTCKLLAGDVYGQQSWVGLTYDSIQTSRAALNVTIPMANGTEVQCRGPSLSFSLGSLVTGRFAGEHLYGLGATDPSQEAEDFCNSFLVMGWSRGTIKVGDDRYNIDASTYENTTILCTPHISSAEFNVVVNNKGLVQRFKRLTPFSYDNSTLFNHSTTIASFKAQLHTIIRTSPYTVTDTAWMHNDRYARSLPHYFTESAGQEPLCDPSTPPPSFEVAQRRFQDFYSWFAAILFGQYSQRIFRSTTEGGGPKPQMSGQIISVQNRVSMDPVMFYIATILLGFSTLASMVIFYSRPKRFLPRLPDTLAAEIGFIYASEALEDMVGTAHMSPGMRERHLANLGSEYGYGRFLGKDGRPHLGVERMERIENFKEES